MFKNRIVHSFFKKKLDYGFSGKYMRTYIRIHVLKSVSAQKIKRPRILRNVTLRVL